jgi:hypothetical protein
MLGTCTKSLAATGLVESDSPTPSIATDNRPPAKGPANEMSNFAVRSGRMDLNCIYRHKNIVQSITDGYNGLVKFLNWQFKISESMASDVCFEKAKFYWHIRHVDFQVLSSYQAL